MLYRLEIKNFYSIRDRQVIDLRAAGNAPAIRPPCAAVAGIEPKSAEGDCRLRAERIG